MALIQVNLTLTGALQRLLDGASGGAGAAEPAGGKLDPTCAQIILTADDGNSAALFIGDANLNPAADLWGATLFKAAAGTQQPLFLGPGVRPSQVYVSGTANDKLHALLTY